MVGRQVLLLFIYCFVSVLVKNAYKMKKNRDIFFKIKKKKCIEKIGIDGDENVRINLIVA